MSPQYSRASYATGRVSGKTKAGGLVGDNSGGTVAASYWDLRATGRVFGAGSDDTSAAGTGIDNNRIDAGEVSRLAAYGKTVQALRALDAAATGWPAPPDAGADEALMHIAPSADGAPGGWPSTQAHRARNERGPRGHPRHRPRRALRRRSE